MSKYHNKKTEVDGILFDSKREAVRWLELRCLERAGKIRRLKRQEKFCLIPPIQKPGIVKQRAVYYIADFTYQQDEDGIWVNVVEDAKGVKTDVYKLKKKLMLWRYGIEIKEV